eukprot:scaffold115_cov304-Prasinococcus_capsulatus_cf.AAC.48
MSLVGVVLILSSLALLVRLVTFGFGLADACGLLALSLPLFSAGTGETTALIGTPRVWRLLPAPCTRT